AVLIDRVDPRVRYPDQVSREMGLTILGAVPHIRAGARPERSGRRVRPPEDVAVVVEALRGVCLNLVYTHGAVAPLVVTITSPGAGDGKSFLAANLGHTFAEAGHRTLRSEEHTSELQSPCNLVCRLLLEKKKKNKKKQKKIKIKNERKK